MTFDPTRRDALKASGVIVIGSSLAACTATGINPAVPPVAKIIQDPAQVQPTAAAPGSKPGTEIPPREKPTYVAQARDPLAYSIATTGSGTTS